MMKTFNASDLSKKPSQVFAAARDGGAVIQHKDRQGNVVEKFIINRTPDSVNDIIMNCSDLDKRHVIKL